jgi:magnesium transporter
LGRSIAEGATVWVDIDLPDPAAASLLGDFFNLGPLTVEDCLSPLRMPKFDPLPDGSAFVAVFAIRLAGGSAPRLQATALTLVVGSTYLVTLSRDRVPEVVARIESVLAADGNVTTPTGPGLAHAALDALVDRHLPVTLQAAEVAEDLEVALDPRAERRGLTALERLIVVRRDLLAFRRLAVAQQEVLRRVGRSFPEVQAQLSDVADNQREAVDTAAATCDYIDGAIEAYRVRRDAQTEDGIRRLSVLAGVFLPVSLLIALWGINFPNIPGTDAAWGWPVFALVQIALILIGAWYFRRRGML